MLHDTRSSRPNSILVPAYHDPSAHHGSPRRAKKHTPEKLLQKRALRPLLHLEKNTHHMVCQLPTIKGLLQVLVALVYQDVDRAWIGNMTIGLEFLADTAANVGGRGGDGVQGNNFRGLCAFRVVKRCPQAGRKTTWNSRRVSSLCRDQ